jgi:predicted nucleic acid-binding protein
VIVVDAGVWVRALVDDGGSGRACRQVLTDDPDWVAPEHVAIEALRTVRRFESAGLLTHAQAGVHAAAIAAAEVRYVGAEPWLLHRVWRHRHNISPYDAPYVVLADEFGVLLETLDERLARAARDLGVAVLVAAT